MTAAQELPTMAEPLELPEPGEPGQPEPAPAPALRPVPAGGELAGDVAGDDMVGDEGEQEPVLERPHERVRLYVWQAPVRITHWVTAGCIVVLALTGGYIADPFLIPPGGNVMSTVRLIHIVAALTFLLSGLVRTWWLLAGNRFARWSAFIPTSRFQATELFRQAGFYGFVRPEIPKVLGHNQLAATAYLALFALLLVETVTGFALDGLMGAEPGATLFGWLRELVGPQLLRLVHHLAMWAILAIALFHVYSCVLVDNLEKNGLLSSIFSGYKFPTREELVESRDGGPELLEPVE
jgi:Ni/Fe-hydrogenase 1 B-type cytochrome subunit